MSSKIEKNVSSAGVWIKFLDIDTLMIDTLDINDIVTLMKHWSPFTCDNVFHHIK